MSQTVHKWVALLGWKDVKVCDGWFIQTPKRFKAVDPSDDLQAALGYRSQLPLNSPLIGDTRHEVVEAVIVKADAEVALAQECLEKAQRLAVMAREQRQ